MEQVGFEEIIESVGDEDLTLHTFHSIILMQHIESYIWAFPQKSVSKYDIETKKNMKKIKQYVYFSEVLP